MGIGFVQDKMDIKFLILYIAARITQPLPLDDLQELTMREEGVTYFPFAEAFHELVDTGHLCPTEEQTYKITAKGLKNSEICASSLPYTVRMRAEKNVAEYNKLLLRRAQVRSRVLPRPNGTYTVELALDDDVDALLRLELMVAKQDQAQDLCGRFQRNPQRVYEALLRALYPEEP